MAGNNNLPKEFIGHVIIIATFTEFSTCYLIESWVQSGKVVSLLGFSRNKKQYEMVFIYISNKHTQRHTHTEDVRESGREGDFKKLAYTIGWW